ncbi:hypothetical protein Ahy_A02g007718 isoform A [Arachis hypogaea]|uniref:Aminotransferase-like plant mobile domain-containing protein n=1 Tax=Arachis hypogaea TaxID=3818 RepID=A0A445ECX8_ARAHY|nr:hypothetical protein Ahy_A02g007718 isoform A [Arachis hypogaea]
MPLHDRIIPYLERAGLYHLARLNSHWFWLDEPLVSAFVERWRPETHTFHMPFGECTVTLQDVAFQLGLPVDGEAVSGCLGEFETYIEGGRPAWEWFSVLPPDANEETVRIYARAYIIMLLSTQLFGDKSANRVHIRWLPFLANLDEMGRWAAYLPPNDGKEQKVISYRLALDRMSARDVSIMLVMINFQILWEPYSAVDVLPVVHPEILTEEHSRIWRVVTSLIYFAVIEWHQVDRVVPQLGGVQHIPEDALNVDWLHAKDGRGGDRWFPHYYRDWHLHWGSRVDAVISIERVADPGPSADYLDWWYREAHRFLSPGAAFTDPRGTQIPEEALQRGSSQVPRRSQLPHMPDNRRVERRRRVGTRESGREWRWIYDMLHEDDAPEEAADVGGHRVRRSSGRRRGPQAATQFGGRASGTTGTETAGDTFTQSFTPTMTMDVDDQMGSAHFYSDFAAVMRDDAGPSHVQVDAAPYQPSAPDVVFDTTAYHPHMTEMQPQVPDFQGQYAVDLNQPAGSPLDTWFTMGGTPQSAYGIAPPVDDAVQVAGRPTRVRRPTRCGTGSHLLDPFEDAARDDTDD